MSPAQSEDSGLAADRGTTYATISLPRDNAHAMGIELLGKWIIQLKLLMIYGCFARYKLEWLSHPRTIT